MILSGNDIIITSNDLIGCGLSDRTARQLKGSYCALKPIYQALIRETLCGGIEPDLYLRNQAAAELNNKLEAFCGSLAGMVEVRNEDIKNLTERGLFAPADIHRIARAAGWLRLWRTMDTKAARKNGFKSVAEIQSEMFKCCLSEQGRKFVRFPKPITNERVLDRKAREYTKEGLNCLISGCFGNANREDINGLAHALLMELASLPTKLSYEDIALLYNQEAEVSGGKIERLTTSAIKQHLNKPKHKRVWSYARHGKIAADHLFQPEILRAEVSRADALWSLDGTTMQIYYRNESGKIQSDLYVYFVTDVYSSAIIGYSVAFSETAGMVTEALKNAIDTHSYKPYQLQYDNSSANVQDAVRGIMANMSRVHFATKPYHGKSKYVETYTGHFQQRVLRQCEYFKGGNITTTSLNSKANPELLAKFRKNTELLPTEQEAIEIFSKAVSEWNSRGEKRDKYGAFIGESKLQRYRHEHADRVQLNYFEKISLFMAELKKPYEYKKQGIEITLNGKKHHYIVPDGDNVGDFEFSRLHLNKVFNVRINPLAPDFITLWQNGVNIATAHEKEAYAACIADMKLNPGQGAKIKQFIRKQEEYGYEYAKSEMERQRAELERSELRATGTDGFGWWDLPKDTFNKVQNAQEDVRNGLETISPAMRALINM